MREQSTSILTADSKYIPLLIRQHPRFSECSLLTDIRTAFGRPFHWPPGSIRPGLSRDAVLAATSEHHYFAIKSVPWSEAMLCGIMVN